MCSRKCDRPASSCVSPREPVPTKKPTAADRTEGMRSVTIRSPLSSVLSWWSGKSARLPAIGIAVGARPVAAVGPVAAARPPVAAAPAVATAPAAAAAVAAAHRRVAGADRRELLGRLAGDVRVVGEAQADAAALAVDLDHPHRDLVALVEDLLDSGGPLARRGVGDVQPALGAPCPPDGRARRGGVGRLSPRGLPPAL